VVLLRNDPLTLLSPKKKERNRVRGFVFDFLVERLQGWRPLCYSN
jgi:hypothetical protein